MLEHIGRYIFKERIGVRGQATVYLAEDPELHRDVAVKVMHQMASEETAYLYPKKPPKSFGIHSFAYREFEWGKQFKATETGHGLCNSMLLPFSVLAL